MEKIHRSKFKFMKNYFQLNKFCGISFHTKHIKI